MQPTNHRAWQLRLALMLILGVAAAAACVVTLMWWKAPVASAQAVEDPTGENFVVQCPFSHQKQVDPIVDFGKPTSFHMHDFFGNTTTDENSTLESLRAGGTTCEKLADTAAYWIPTVSWTDSSGTTGPIKANQEFFYYKLGGKSSKIDVNPHPAGLKIVTVQGRNVEWRCANDDWKTSPPSRCDNGKLVVRIKFPDCLAVNSSGQPLLDSADHRSHMVDAVKPDNSTVKKCPSTHPYPVPMLQTNFQYPIPTTRGTVTLSSGTYSTMHADFFNAWQEGALEDLVARCINAGPFTSSNPKPADCA
jgi:hypothetical protein